MLRVSDPVKVEQWSERLRRFGESGQTVADFCRAECVSQASFYRWKKTLGCPRTKIRSVCSDSSGELGSSLESLPSMGSFQAVEVSAQRDRWRIGLDWRVVSHELLTQLALLIRLFWRLDCFRSVRSFRSRTRYWRMASGCWAAQFHGNSGS